MCKKTLFAVWTWVWICGSVRTYLLTALQLTHGADERVTQASLLGGLGAGAESVQDPAEEIGVVPDLCRVPELQESRQPSQTRLRPGDVRYKLEQKCFLYRGNNYIFFYN